VRAIVVLAPVLGAACLLVAAAATASSPGRNGSLLASISRPANAGGTAYTPASLYSLGLNGRLRLLVHDPAHPIEIGSYSPGGATVAFARVSPTTHKLGLWLMNAAGGPARKIVSDLPDGVFAWAPDGDHLAVVRFDVDEIALIDLHGRQVRVLARGIRVREMDWASDGRTLYFEGNAASPAGAACRPGICAVDVRNGRLRQVVLNDQRRTSWAHYGISVAPDGKRIAFMRSCFSGDCKQLRDTDGIVVANANGSHARVLVRDTAAGVPVWSPDGSSVAFVRQWTGSGPPENTVELVSVSTGAVTRLRTFHAPPSASTSPPAVQLLSWQPR
jgi:Tol biopolymer transport system component